MDTLKLFQNDLYVWMYGFPKGDYRLEVRDERGQIVGKCSTILKDVDHICIRKSDAFFNGRYYLYFSGWNLGKMDESLGLYISDAPDDGDYPMAA